MLFPVPERYVSQTWAYLVPSLLPGPSQVSFYLQWHHIYHLEDNRFSLVFISCFLAECKCGNGQNVCPTMVPDGKCDDHLLSTWMNEWNTWWQAGLPQILWCSWNTGIFWESGPETQEALCRTVPHRALLGREEHIPISSSVALLRRWASVLSIPSVWDFPCP